VSLLDRLIGELQAALLTSNGFDVAARE
jgi:hypothetical protein